MKVCVVVCAWLFPLNLRDNSVILHECPPILVDIFIKLYSAHSDVFCLFKYAGSDWQTCLYVIENRFTLAYNIAIDIKVINNWITFYYMYIKEIPSIIEASDFIYK